MVNVTDRKIMWLDSGQAWQVLSDNEASINWQWLLECHAEKDAKDEFKFRGNKCHDY